MSVLQGADGWIPWRKTFDNQVGNVWPGLDLILEDIRDMKDPVGESEYDDLVAKHDCISEDTFKGDWKFARLMRHVHTIIYNYNSDDVRKVTAQCSERNGFEHYRLLNREFDAIDTGSKFQMCNACMGIAGWPVKGLPQLVQAARELSLRVSAYERRSGMTFPPESSVGIMYQLLLKDKDQLNELQRAKALDDFVLMKKALEDMHKLQAASRPRPMQLDYAAERPEEELWAGQIEYNDYISAGGLADDFYPAFCW